MEAGYERRVFEVNRRLLQGKVREDLAFEADKKKVARTLAKQFCRPLKRDSLGHLTDIGHLRSWKSYSLGMHLIAPLYN